MYTFGNSNLTDRYNSGFLGYTGIVKNNEIKKTIDKKNVTFQTYLQFFSYYSTSFLGPFFLIRIFHSHWFLKMN